VEKKDTFPRFRVDKKLNPPVVYLQCSKCEKDIRKLGMKEQISVQIAHYCDDCDDGTIVLNLNKT